MGDCGALVHFDPVLPTDFDYQNSSNLKNIQPLYINAEYFIDLKKINAPGDFLSSDSITAIRRSLRGNETSNANVDKLRITLPQYMHEAHSEMKMLKTWKNMKHGFYPCGSCDLFGCRQADDYIINEVIYQLTYVDVIECFSIDTEASRIIVGIEKNRAEDHRNRENTASKIDNFELIQLYPKHFANVYINCVNTLTAFKIVKRMN